MIAGVGSAFKVARQKTKHSASAMPHAAASATTQRPHRIQRLQRRRRLVARRAEALRVALGEPDEARVRSRLGRRKQRRRHSRAPGAPSERTDRGRSQDSKAHYRHSPRPDRLICHSPVQNSHKPPRFVARTKPSLGQHVDRKGAHVDTQVVVPVAPGYARARAHRARRRPACAILHARASRVRPLARRARARPPAHGLLQRIRDPL